jgi:acyl-CoA thioesterase
MTLFHPSMTPEEKIDVFNTCEFAVTNGMRIESAGDDGIRVTMDPAGKLNPNGTIHGGAIFSLADQAFGIAANLESVPEVAVSASIQYLAPATGTLAAVAVKVEDTPGISLFRVEVLEGSRLIAVFHGNGFKIRNK